MILQLLRTGMFIALCLCISATFAQQQTQTLRGTVLDQDSKTPLQGVAIKITNVDPPQGTVTDINGKFKIEKVPIGRVNLIFTYMGYETRTMPNVLIGSAQEVVLNISMRESIETTEEVVVKANRNNSRVLNEMTMVSGREFSVEETKRYAGSINDPARMVSGFAGVTGNAEGDNDIVVRGNSPKGILWRLEGVEIANPNHFSNEGSTGGPINALNSKMLDNSDFMSGAFAPEYGNALSGVFDMNLKKGNDEKREYTLGISTIGFDLTAEGPLGKKKNASYIANYRYSSLDVLDKTGIVDFGGVPKYQDACVNIIFPLGEKNTIKIFGLGGMSSISIDEKDENEKPLYKDEFQTDLAVTGLSHTYYINKKSYLKTTGAFVGTRLRLISELYHDEEKGYYDLYNSTIEKGKTRLLSTYHLKVNAKNKIQIGGIYSHLSFNTFSEVFDFADSTMQTDLNDNGNSYTLQGFVSWKHRFNKQWTMTTGMHYLQFGLNNSYSVEPRWGLQYMPNVKNTVSLGFGMHSRMESIAAYLAKNENGVSVNKNLEPTKAAHFVLGYQHHFNRLTHLKVEMYYQHLYDVPVEDVAGSNYALLNETGGYITRSLANKGTGRNYGLELTLERYFDKGLYYMTTLSLYESLYTPINGKEYNTRFNGNYAFNVLGGKEFNVGKQKKNRVMFVNAKVGILGGARYSPIDLEASQNAGYEVRNTNPPFSMKGDDVFFLNLALGTRRDRPKTTHELKVDISNVTNNQATVNEYYAMTTGQIERSAQLAILPNIVYTIKF